MLVEQREKLSVDRLVGVWLVSTPTRVENWPAPTCSYRLVISVVIKWATPRVPAGWIPVKIDSKRYCGRLTLSPEGSLWYGHHPLPLDIETGGRSEPAISSGPEGYSPAPAPRSSPRTSFSR